VDDARAVRLGIDNTKVRGDWILAYAGMTGETKVRSDDFLTYFTAT